MSDNQLTKLRFYDIVSYRCPTTLRGPRTDEKAHEQELPATWNVMLRNFLRAILNRRELRLVVNTVEEALEIRSVPRVKRIRKSATGQDARSVPTLVCSSDKDTDFIRWLIEVHGGFVSLNGDSDAPLSERAYLDKLKLLRLVIVMFSPGSGVLDGVCTDDNAAVFVRRSLRVLRALELQEMCSSNYS